MHTISKITSDTIYTIFLAMVLLSLSFVGGYGFGVDNTAQAQTTQAQAASDTAECAPYLRDYLKRGEANDSLEVLKLQSFLKTVAGYDQVPLNGSFGAATEQAVHQFQQRHADDVLNPWGYADNQSTGYVYITTTNKINEIICGQDISLNAAQKQEIQHFRSRLTDSSTSTTTAGDTALSGENDTTVIDEQADNESDSTSNGSNSSETTATPTTSQATDTLAITPMQQTAATVYTSVNNVFSTMFGFIFSWNFLFLLIGILIGLMISPYTHSEPAPATSTESNTE